jgi:hypothetical protein
MATPSWVQTAPFRHQILVSNPSRRNLARLSRHNPPNIGTDEARNLWHMQMGGGGVACGL